MEEENFPVPLSSLPRSVYHSHKLHEGVPVTLRIAESQRGGTGWRVWRAARFLCRFLERGVVSQPEMSLAGRSILELGAGCGLVGILCGHLGGRVLITDLDNVLPFTLYNVEQNAIPPGSCGDLKVAELSWGSDITATFPQGSFDIIVGSDLSWCIQWDGPLLLATLLQLVDEHTVILVSLTLRPRQLENWHNQFGDYFTITVEATDGDADLFDPTDKLASRPEPESTWRSEEEDEYRLKHFDDSGDEGRSLNVLRLTPLLPLPSRSDISSLIQAAGLTF